MGHFMAPHGFFFFLGGGGAKREENANYEKFSSSKIDLISLYSPEAISKTELLIISDSLDAYL